MYEDKFTTLFFVENNISEIFSSLLGSFNNETDFFSVLMCIQYLIERIFQEMEHKPFEGGLSLLTLII
jgi:hypothetical protein